MADLRFCSQRATQSANPADQTRPGGAFKRRHSSQVELYRAQVRHLHPLLPSLLCRAEHASTLSRAKPGDDQNIGFWGVFIKAMYSSPGSLRCCDPAAG